MVVITLHQVWLGIVVLGLTYCLTMAATNNHYTARKNTLLTAVAIAGVLAAKLAGTV